MIESFPGGSKKRVNRAGENVRNRNVSPRDLRVIEEWRAAHRAVLNTFQATLRGRTRYLDVTVAQRHKRRRTIFDKLLRFPKMKLVRMDDVAGCRLIFESIEALYQFRKEFHRARFNHKLRNDPDRYDYIKNPKDTGYRGVHDVYEYDVRSRTGQQYAGLYVEIQYRTLVQHAWATTVEVIGFVTENQPKFERGDDRYQHAMALASEILARAHENSTGPFPDKGNKELVAEFLALDEDIHLVQTLRGLNSAENVVSSKKNAILIFSGTEGDLEIIEYRDATDALRRLFELEEERPGSDIVLVRADTSEEVRIAFRNYFSDPGEFLRLLEEGCTKLSGKKSVVRKLRRHTQKKKRVRRKT